MLSVGLAYISTSDGPYQLYYQTENLLANVFAAAGHFVVWVLPYWWFVLTAASLIVGAVFTFGHSLLSRRRDR